MRHTVARELHEGTLVTLNIERVRIRDQIRLIYRYASLATPMFAAFIDFVRANSALLLASAQS